MLHVPRGSRTEVADMTGRVLYTHPSCSIGHVGLSVFPKIAPQIRAGPNPIAYRHSIKAGWGYVRV